MTEGDNNNSDNSSQDSIQQIIGYNSYFNDDGFSPPPSYSQHIDKKPMISKSQRASRKKQKFKFITIIVAIFGLITMGCFVVYILFSTDKLGFKFLEAQCKLQSTEIKSTNITSPYDSSSGNINNNSVIGSDESLNTYDGVIGEGLCSPLNVGQWWYVYDKEYYKYTFFQSNSTMADNSTSNNIKQVEIIDSMNNKTITCYQGIYNVEYMANDKHNVTGIVYGLWTQHRDRVVDYLDQIKVDKSFSCYYNKYNESQIIIIKPPSSLINVLVICLFGLILVSIITTFFICLRRAYATSIKEKQQLLNENKLYFRYSSSDSIGYSSSNNNNNY
ncbi:hypothetical protein CYY_005857 [Polysphondylium violaceum]|uniref:Uncharacterized protein n=1 Tax=Polysphondylium violaceum TaxID=133409 RepID=A0A8J4PT68_9MYCE|nr:hypothetical protein CYY_005857 [Polysphondylium violaceum]